MAVDAGAANRALLLERLRGGKAPLAAAPPLRAPTPGERVPLTRGQEQMWLDSQLAPNEAVYNEPVMVRRTGRCDVESLRRAFNLVLSRHDVWRANFVNEGGEAHQVVRPHVDHPLPLIDLSDLPAHERDARAMALSVADAGIAFDLEHDMLVRPLLVRVTEDDHRLYLTLHHLIFDTVALRMLLSEMVAAYLALVAGHEVQLADPPAPFAHYACWERRHSTPDALESKLAFWRDRLRGATPVALPADRPEPSPRTRNGAMARTFVDRPTIDRLNQIARQEGATFSLVLLTAYATVLHRYSGQEDLVIAALVDGRRHRALERVMGFMINPLPVRVDVTGDPTFAELLGRVRESFLTGLANEVPFGDLLRALSPGLEPSRSSIFRAMFSLDPPLPPLGDGWELDEIDVEFAAAKCDVQLLQDEREEGLVGRFVYSTDLFAADTWQRLAERWGVLLEGIAADPTCRISALPFLTDTERTTLLDEWNRTEVPYPSTARVHELIEAQARLRPRAIAVVLGDRRVTYGQLDAQADRLADCLRSLGVVPDTRVGVFVERSPEMVVAVLGILKAGGAYVPLDPACPRERLALMVDDAGVRTIVSQARLRSRLPPTDALTVCVDDLDPAPAPGTSVGASAGPDDLAYVIYTSGSTGVPKGVMIEHRGVVNHIAALIRDYGLGPADTVIQLPSLTFHPSVRDILGTLSAGARLVLLDEVEAKDPSQILRTIACEAVTCALSMVPSLLRTVLDDPRSGEIPDARLRLLLTCGEELSEQDARRARERFGCVVANQFGPTETIMACSKHTTGPGDPPGAMVPAGKPEANARLYVVDRHGGLAPIGAPGELLVGGLGVARGYLNRPDLTAERFRADPFCAAPGARVHRTGDRVRYRNDGCLEFLGRVDHQVKVRGHRVELGEVEAALARCGGVGQAAAAVRTDAQGDGRLVGVIVADGDGVPPDVGAVRAQLERFLPGYMVPAGIAIVDRLPLTPNGKVDRAALDAIRVEGSTGVRHEAPEPGIETAVAEIWADALGRDRIGRHDDFFDLGGHSLMAARVIATIERRFGHRLPLAVFFGDGATVAGLSEAIAGAADAPDVPAAGAPNEGAVQEETSVVPLRAGGSKPPLFMAHGVWHLVRRLDPHQPVYGLQPRSQYVLARQHLHIEDLAGRYVDDILSTQPCGPYRLAGFCFGGVLVLEIAHRLEQLGHTVDGLALFDTELPTSGLASRTHREIAEVAALIRRDETARAYLRRRFTNARARAQRWEHLAKYRFHVRTGRPVTDWDDVERARVLHLQRRALGSYVVPTTKCPVTWFRAGSPTAAQVAVRFLHEGDGAGHYVIDGPGVSHRTLLEEPHVRAVADALTALLARADRDPDGLGALDHRDGG